MKIVAVIPAKMGATRFKGKPLAPIRGVPMIGHIHARVSLAKNIDAVYVAAHDEEIKKYIDSKGGKAVMEHNTEKNAPSGVLYALPEIEREIGAPVDWIIMVQGDEPMIMPEIIDALAEQIRINPDHKVINVIDEIRRQEEYVDQNIVKVILNVKGDGMWFFRIPSERWKDGLSGMPIKKQTGIIALRKDVLESFGKGERSPVERIESVDMFRLIENADTVPVIHSPGPLYSVDTPEDLSFVEGLMENDELIRLYAEKYGS